MREKRRNFFFLIMDLDSWSWLIWFGLIDTKKNKRDIYTTGATLGIVDDSFRRFKSRSKSKKKKRQEKKLLVSRSLGHSHSDSEEVIVSTPPSLSVLYIVLPLPTTDPVEDPEEEVTEVFPSAEVVNLL